MLTALAQMVRSRDDKLRDELLEAALTIIDLLPSAYEKVEHHLWMASLIQRVNPMIAKKCIATAMHLCQAPDGRNELKSAQRRIVDLAYALDPNFANTLAKTMDTDPARPWAKLPGRERFEALQLKKKIVDDGLSPEGLDFESRKRLPSTAWLLLASLNSSRLLPVKFENAKALVRIAGELPLADSFPVFAFAVVNIVKKYGRSDRAREEIRPLFEAAIASCRFVDLVSGVQTSRSVMSVVQGSDEIVIRAGDRDAAMALLSAWAERLEQNALVKICDPYFNANDLDIVRAIQRSAPTVHISIATSKAHQLLMEGGMLEDMYAAKWREMSEEAPPHTEIVVVSVEPSGESTIHDRWILSRDSGLKFGASFNSVGRAKDSSVTRMNAAEAVQAEAVVDTVLLKQTRTHRGAKVRYTVIEL